MNIKMNLPQEVEGLKIPVACQNEHPVLAHRAVKDPEHPFTCYECKRKLILRESGKGGRRRHFAHATQSACRGQGETTAHYHAKALLEERLSDISFEHCCPSCKRVCLTQDYDGERFEAVSEDTKPYPQGVYRPDAVVLDRKTRQVKAILEVRATHAVEPEKAAYLEEKFPGNFHEFLAVDILQLHYLDSINITCCNDAKEICTQCTEEAERARKRKLQEIADEERTAKRRRIEEEEAKQRHLEEENRRAEAERIRFEAAEQKRIEREAKQLEITRAEVKRREELAEKQRAQALIDAKLHHIQVYQLPQKGAYNAGLSTKQIEELESLKQRYWKNGLACPAGSQYGPHMATSCGMRLLVYLRHVHKTRVY